MTLPPLPSLLPDAFAFLFPRCFFFLFSELLLGFFSVGNVSAKMPRVVKFFERK